MSLIRRFAGQIRILSSAVRIVSTDMPAIRAMWIPEVASSMPHPGIVFMILRRVNGRILIPGQTEYWSHEEQKKIEFCSSVVFFQSCSEN